MANHTTYAAWPVSCAVCSAITTANFKEAPLVYQACKTSNVKSITDPCMWKGDG
jgi:hypothetical protein